jgi:hypothetical protein
LADGAHGRADGRSPSDAEGLSPVQGGKSFDMSNVIQEFINNARQ